MRKRRRTSSSDTKRLRSSRKAGQLRVWGRHETMSRRETQERRREREPGERARQEGKQSVLGESRRKLQADMAGREKEGQTRRRDGEYRTGRERREERQKGREKREREREREDFSRPGGCVVACQCPG